MAPGPTLEQLIATVRRDAGSDDPLDQLATAARMAADLQDVADAALSHFVDQCRHSGRSWTEISTALGVTKQAAHKRFSETQLLGRFTPRVRNLFAQAAAAARRLGHNYVGTEHFLLALFEDQTSIAAKVLADAQVTEQHVETLVLQAAPRGSSTDDAPLRTPAASAVFRRAIAEAVRLGHNYVGTEHVLLALFGESEALSARVLAQTGATYDDYRRRVIDKLSRLVVARPEQ